MEVINGCKITDSKNHINSELISWAQLFEKDAAFCSPEQLLKGSLLFEIFVKIDENPKNEFKPTDGTATMKTRLDKWHILLRSIRTYYLEVLQEVILMRPPNIVLLSKLPVSTHAQREVEQLLLLLLCAAVRCDRRDHFIRQIMERLDRETQTGIMDQIKSFTESPDCIVTFEQLQSSTSDLLRVVRDAMDRMEDLYIGEIKELIDQLNALQSKLNATQAHARLICRSRARSSGSGRLKKRSVSAVSLGDPTRGEWTEISTPKLVFRGHAEDLSIVGLGPDISVGHLEEVESENGLEMHNEEQDLSNEVAAGECGSSDYFHCDLHMNRLDGSNHDVTSLGFPDPPDLIYSDADKHRLSIELADTKAKLRRARVEIEDQNDQLNELHDQLTETRRELGLVKEERARLADAAHSARHWQDEVDALRETAERVQHLESENSQLKRRSQEAEYYKARCNQLTCDLMKLSDEHVRQSSQPSEDSSVCMKCDNLKQQLTRTTALLSELEELHNAALDEMQQLRVELGQLRVEQSVRTGRMNNTTSDSTKPADATDSDEACNSSNVFGQIKTKLSDQLTEAVSSRLTELEFDNRRLTEELERVRSSVRAADSDKVVDTTEVNKTKKTLEQCIGTDNVASQTTNTMDNSSSPRTSSDRDHTSTSTFSEAYEQDKTTHSNLHNRGPTKTTSIHFCDPTCPELVRSLQNSFHNAQKEILLLQEERAELKSKLFELERKCTLNTQSRLNELFSEGASDGDVDEDDEEVEEDEADSGNKTGESTEEASPDQFNLGRIRRKTFDVVLATNRYHGRKRKSKTNMQAELIRFETELDRLKNENDSLKVKLDHNLSNLTEKENEIKQLKKQIELTDSLPKDISSTSQMHDTALADSNTILCTAEQQIHRIRQELREMLNNPTSTPNGKALIQRLYQLVLQLSKPRVTRNDELRQNETGHGELEREYAEVYEQLTSERRMVLTLRDQLVTQKIQAQHQLALINSLQLGLKQFGFPEDKVAQLLQPDINVNHLELLGQLLRGYVSRQSELSHTAMGQQQKQNSDTVSPNSSQKIHRADCTISLATDNDGATNPSAADLLAEVKSRSVELERENAELNQSLQNVVKLADEYKSRLGHLEQTTPITQEQLVLLRRQVAELVATNARLAVENTTLTGQAESLTAQHSRLINHNAELQAEIAKLRSMLESAHASEAHLTTDYYHLQRLHEQLTHDYDLTCHSLKESKELHRQIKNELTEARSQIGRLQSEADEVCRLKLMLESERDTLKGESKQSVILREECARLRAQLDAATETRDRERMEKIVAADRNRELRRQLDEMVSQVNKIGSELDARRHMDQKLQAEVVELRCRVQAQSEKMEKLEEEKKVLLFKLQSILGQNQELLTSTLVTCQNRASEEEALRERLLSLQRHRQFLEDKLLEQYRTVPQSKKIRRRTNFVQKARAALAKWKDSNEYHSKAPSPTSVNFLGDIRKQTNSMHSQDSNSSGISASAESEQSSRFAQRRLIPGSVSIYDRDPAEYDTGDLQEFLRYLNQTRNSEQSHNKLESRNTAYENAQSTSPLSGRTISTSPAVSVIHSARQPSGDGCKNTVDLLHPMKMSRLISPRPVDSRHRCYQNKLSPRPLNSGSASSSNPSLAGSLNQAHSEAPKTQRTTKTRNSDSGGCVNLSFNSCPTTERSDEKLREIVVIKSIPRERNCRSQNDQYFKIPRSISMRSITSVEPSSHEDVTGNARYDTCKTNGSENPGKGLSTFIKEKQVKRWATTHENNNSVMSTPVSNVDSRLDTSEAQQQDGTSNQPVSLEVIGRPRVLLEYGDL